MDIGLEQSIGTTGVIGLALCGVVKPEIGKGKCCAYMECLAHKPTWIAQNNHQNILQQSCFPSFHIMVTGPFFQGKMTENLYNIQYLGVFSLPMCTAIHYLLHFLSLFFLMIVR
jgi:hypothetical protein